MLIPVIHDTFLSTNQSKSLYLDPVYTGMDPNGSLPVWVQIDLPFTLDLLDPYLYGSTIRASLGSPSEVYSFGSVPVEVQCKRLDPIQTGTQ